MKAQVQVGGRGKAGGIKLANDADEVRTHAGNILGMDIKGHIVEIVWIELASDIAEEYYASFTLDRSAKKHLGHALGPGRRRDRGRRRERPRRHRQDLDRPRRRPHRGRRPGPGWRRPSSTRPPPRAPSTSSCKLYTAYTEGDADLAEINPLILKPTGEVHALDAKVTLDGNSVFRHPDYEQYDATQVRDEREQAAHEKGLQYVGLDGFVGVIANGAGLAMSTVDIVNQVGGKPANFLDIGGGANADVMAGALEVINNDPNVRSIFINIFGGITKGDEVANGIITAMGRVDIDVPIVIRLDGTNADEGRAHPRAPPVRQAAARARPWSKPPKPSSPLPAPGSRRR